MEILNIMQCTHLGGMEQASLRLMQALTKRGHRCRVLSLNPLGSLHPLLDASGISAAGMQYRGALGWRSFPELYARLSKERADALIMTGHNLLAMLALGRLCKGRRLLAIHFHHSVRADWQWQIFYRLAEARFSAISFPSDFIRKEAERIRPSLQRIARTIRNPLDAPTKPTATSRREARSRLGLPSEAWLVGNAGWLIRRKRFDVFLKTAALVAAKNSEARFVIAGDGPERQELQTLSDRLGIADRIHWLGWVRRMQDFYCSVDLLLFNSDWDAMGNTPVEAMAYGVPVVASVQNGGLGEIISDERFGHLLDNHDPDELAQAVIDRIANGSVFPAGRERVVVMSDPCRIAKEVEELLACGDG